MATLQLKNGKMPLVGLGTWKMDNDKCCDLVYTAIKAGYRLIDCACDYGNEVEVGQGIKKAIDEGIVTREDLFVTSKLWNTFHHPEHVRAAFDRTKNDLGLSYLDLYLVHFPISLKYVEFSERYPPGWKYAESDEGCSWDPVPIYKTWNEMESLVNEGLVKDIGVSNFSGSLMMDLLGSCNIPPAVNQIEIHPYLPQLEYVKWLQEKGIQVTAYSSFGSISYLEVFAQFSRDVPSLLENDVIKSIGNTHSKSTAQILLRWAVQRNCAVVPKSSNEDRLKENLDILSFSLSDSEMDSINKLDQNIRFNNPGRYANLPIFA